MSEIATDTAQAEVYVVTSVNGEQMRATRVLCDGTEGYLNMDAGPGYRFWGDAYVASAEREACGHEWDLYWDGSLGHPRTEGCVHCDVLRPAQDLVTPPELRTGEAEA